MKINKNEKNIFLVVTYAILLIFILFNVSHIIKALGYIIKLLYPFILGAIIAFVINILVNFFEKKVFKSLTESKNKLWKAIKRPISIILSFTIIISFLILLFNLIVPQLKDTAEIFVDNLPEYLDKINKDLNHYNIETNIINTINNNLNNLKDLLFDYIKGNKGIILDTTIIFASNIITGIVNITIAIVFAIYILLQKEKINKHINNILKAYLNDKLVKKIHDVCLLSNKTFTNFVSGQVLEALIIGILCFLGMVIIKIPYAGPISVLVGFTALIPVFGAFIGTVIGAFLILMVSPINAIIFVIFIIILQQLEGNLIYPYVVGKQVGLPGILVFIAVTIGASINGVVGMLLSVPITSIIYSLIVTNVKNRLTK